MSPLPAPALGAPPPAWPPIPPAYRAALDAGAQAKFELFERWIPLDATGTLVDIGCGPGGVTARIAAARPACAVLGLDAHPEMVAQAAARHAGRPNLRFDRADAGAALAGPHGVCLLSSVLHEVAAAAGPAAVERALRAAAAGLGRGGRLIVRDFVRPAGAAQPVRLRHARHDLVRGRSFADFAAAARFPVRLDRCRIEPGAICCDTDLEGAYEFVMRKDCGDAWAAELGQRYAFWSVADCLRLLRDAGLRLLHLEAADDRWIVQQRLLGRVELLDAGSGRALPVPATKLIAIAEKP